MRTIVIYPGRFHPFHRGHKASYDYLVQKYGAGNVFIATSNVQAPITSPFSFEDKEVMMTRLGIPVSHIAQVRNPYQAQEITSAIDDPEHTALVFAVSEKDMSGEGARFKFGTKKDGSPSYMQPMPSNPKKMKPMSKHAYVDITPTVNFKVRGADADSASAIRKQYIEGTDADRGQIIADLYGEVYPDIQDIFDQKLGVVQKVTEIMYGRPIVDDNSMSASGPMQREHKEKMVKILESVKHLERRARDAYRPLVEDIVEDYIDERKSFKK